MKNMTRLLSLTILPAAISIAADRPKTTARQGEPTTEFRSPMILDTPFFIAAESLTSKDTGWISGTENTGIYYCENVAVSAIRMKATLIDAESVSVTIEGTIHNRIGHDKLVTITGNILNGEELAASFQWGPAFVREPEFQVRSAKVNVPRAKLIKDPITMLRLSVTAIDY